ncbi:MAG: energy transducer TonB [Candidatus Sulfotelmatobacter sp.]
MLKPAIFVIALSLCLAGSALAQNAPTSSSAERKVTSRVAPSYPELAKRMHLQGVVKIEAIVRPNGTVKSTRVVGGNPVLVDAATEAVKQWKFEAGSSETTELLQLTFIPQ